MNINPYLRISLYKITAIYMLLVGIFETNGWRQTAFTKLLWQVDYPYIHFYLPLLFIVIWALVYLVERSFGLTMAAFRLRSRAGVTAWFDVLILLLMIPIAYASAFNRTMIPIEYQSDSTSLYSPFLIWFQIFTSLSAIQSLSTLGEYRFNRNQPVDPPQTGLPVAPVTDTTDTPVSGNTNPPVPTPVPPVGSTGAATVTPVITPPPPTPSVGSTGAATVTPVITPLPVPSVGATGATTVPQPLITPPPPTPSVGSTGAATVTPVITPPPVAPAAPTGSATVTRVITPPPVSPLAPTGSATATPPLNTLPPETPVDPAVVVPTSESTPTPAVTEVFPTPTIPIPTVDPTPTAEVQSTLPLGEASLPMSDTQLSVWERIKRLFGVKPPAPTQLVMSEVTANATTTDTPPAPAATATDAPQEGTKLIV